MQISVTCRHMETSDAIREYAFERIQNGLKDFPRVIKVHLILDVQKYRHLAEIVLHGKNHVDVEALAESDDMYASIDQAVEKAAKQLRKLRDKIQDHKTTPIGVLEKDRITPIPEGDLS